MKPGDILEVMPDQMRNAFLQTEINLEEMEEIRIRTGKPLFLYIDNKEYILTTKGIILSEAGAKKDIYKVCENDIKEMLDRLTGYSLYAYAHEFRQGYFTLRGGHRVGVSGKTVVEDGIVKTMKDIQFMNIRVAHEKRNCGKKVIGRLLKEGKLRHTLLISSPGQGKTTLLRDLIRLISDGFYYEEAGKRTYFEGLTVGVVDERSEIGAAVNGIPTMDLGIRTDLMDGCPKHVGIFMLLRSMAPKVIAVDEIGDDRDFEAIRQAVNSGCTILATAHGSSLPEMERKKLFASFLKEQIFERCVILSSRNGKGTVERIEVMR